MYTSYAFFQKDVNKLWQLWLCSSREEFRTPQASVIVLPDKPFCDLMSLPLPPVHNYMLQIFKKQKQSLKYLHVLLHNRARQRTKQNLLKYISSNRTYHKIGLIYVYSNSQSICNIGYIFYNFVTEIKCLVSDLVAVFLVTTAASGSPEKKTFPNKT